MCACGEAPFCLVSTPFQNPEYAPGTEAVILLCTLGLYYRRYLDSLRLRLRLYTPMLYYTASYDFYDCNCIGIYRSVVKSITASQKMGVVVHRDLMICRTWASQLEREVG